MMLNAHDGERRIVRLYVSAYMDVYGAILTSAAYEHLLELIDACAVSRIIPVYFGLECISSEAKINRMVWLLERYQLSDLCRPLMVHLIQDGYGFLVCDVLKAIVMRYEEIHRIVPVEIGLANPVSDAVRTSIVAWVKRLIVSHEVRITYYYDTALLAGIRLETKRHMVEYSVRKQLYDISELCKREDMRWQ